MTVRPGIQRGVLLGLIAIVAVGGFLLWRARTRPDPALSAVPTTPVERRDITVTIEATGTVEPIALVEIKSKASGQITSMPVEIGSQVAAGDLLVQIDTRDVKNQYDQALAALRAAQAKADISQSQKKRSDDLLAQGVITATEHESATLDYANAQSSLVTARTNLDLAKQRLDDATVRAPLAGTVLSQLVSSGQVIASATSSASGGTSLLTMADLSRIRLRALVAETDVGNVHPGQPATVTVDAFAQRNFQGRVEKIEPQAVVQQSVTMFPVLISISNDERLLLPGMNGEVTMLVDQRSDVLAIPVDAVRSVREIPTVAAALGMNPDSVRAQVQRQMASQANAAGPDSSRGRQRGMGRGSFGADSSARRARWMQRGGFPGDSSARARWMQRGGRGGGAGGFGGGRGNGMAGGGAGSGRGFGAYSAAAGGASAGAPALVGRSRASRAQLVFIKTPAGLEPRPVRLGISDFDYSEVLSGLKEGDQVALLSVAELQAKRKDDQSRIRQRMGGGVPGVPGGAGGGGGGGGGRGGGGGGGRGGP